MQNLGLGFGARALAMGGTYIAVAEGLTAVGYNPAGLAKLRQPEFMLGASFGVQTVRVPAFDYYHYDWDTIYGSSAYDFRIGGVSYDHAGAAFRIRGGKQSFVIGLSSHRELHLRAPYAYKLERWGPRSSYWTPDGGVHGTYAATEDFSIDDAVSLDVFSATLAFRIAKNFSFGLNVNLRRGRARTHERRDYSYAVSDGGVAVLSGEGYELWEGPETLSGGTNVDLGLLWETRLFSVGVVYRTGFNLDHAYSYQYDNVETVSYGETYEQHSTFSYEYSHDRQAQGGIGLSFRPGKSWLLSVEFRAEEGTSSEDWVVPGVHTQFRAGVEHRLAKKEIEIPLRVGWFISETDLYEHGSNAWISGLTLGTGLVRGSFALDIAALFHSKTADLYTAQGPVHASSWGLTMSLSYRLGKPG